MCSSQYNRSVSFVTLYVKDTIREGGGGGVQEEREGTEVSIV